MTNSDLIEYLEFNDDFVFICFESETPILEKLFPNYQMFMYQVFNLILAKFSFSPLAKIPENTSGLKKFLLINNIEQDNMSIQ